MNDFATLVINNTNSILNVTSKILNILNIVSGVRALSVFHVVPVIKQ